MEVVELTAIIAGQRVLFRVGDIYTYNGEVKRTVGKRVVLRQIFAGNFSVATLLATYAPCDGGCTESCPLEKLIPLSPLEQLANEAE